MAQTIGRVESVGFSYPHEVVGADGTVPVSDGAGLGVEYDWDYVEDNATGSVHVYE